ncbi:hypothetical protein [Nakamurella sp. PAMC28650]|uniref:hypothetical protein n=1 Tax=Nakamurella sp. PAMC28650 TaxID=2762325 RepID=UPI00164DE52C|nr:hypothetical protein [Nakamurella sp. PAMC28650]QNK79344.1 hypothetical protein H7F38_13580 [Nakamurella sp. PAMC28650]
MTITASRWSRKVVAVAATAVLAAGFLTPSAEAHPPGALGSSGRTGVEAGQTAAPLTNLAHLNFLTDRVTVPVTAAHSTYRLDTEPSVGVLWVYADPRPGNTFARVGGGGLDPVTGHWGQGSFDGDDIARAAIVYLRQWKATGDISSKTEAYEQLRGLAYLQTLTGPHTGESVLWMQPDGTLNPSPTPADSPNPSDSGASYWLARSLWAFGEGSAAFRDADPPFAAFLQSRMDLAVSALQRDVLSDYGKYQIIHGIRVPAWLIVDGADASSEAMLGLSSYVEAIGTRTVGGSAARIALGQLAAGVAQMSAGTTTTWPYRAVLPWALSRSDWHAWGAQMPAGLAAASAALQDKSLLGPAVGDAAGFTPHLLTATGPDNGWLPIPVDGTQIAYGVDARVQSLLAVATASGSRGIRALAGIAASWFFGQNTANTPVYDPSTGVTNDGVSASGTVNRGSGAESTIHGLLTMQVLDANPDLAAIARASSHLVSRDGQKVIEAETGVLQGNASVRNPSSAWTGESQWSGSFVAAGAGSAISWPLAAADQPRLVQPIAELTPGSNAQTRFTADGRALGRVRFGAVGAQGNAPSPTELLPIDLRMAAPAKATSVIATTVGGYGNLDALLVIPMISTLITDGGGHGTVLLSSVAASSQLRRIVVPGSGPTVVRAYDRNGVLQRCSTGGAGALVEVLPGGFTIASR